MSIVLTQVGNIQLVYSTIIINFIAIAQLTKCYFNR